MLNQKTFSWLDRSLRLWSMKFPTSKCMLFTTKENFSAQKVSYTTPVKIIILKPKNHPIEKENHLNQTSMTLSFMLKFRGVNFGWEPGGRFKPFQPNPKGPKNESLPGWPLSFFRNMPPKFSKQMRGFIFFLSFGGWVFGRFSWKILIFLRFFSCFFYMTYDVTSLETATLTHASSADLFAPPWLSGAFLVRNCLEATPTVVKH